MGTTGNGQPATAGVPWTRAQRRRPSALRRAWAGLRLTVLVVVTGSAAAAVVAVAFVALLVAVGGKLP